MKKKMIIAFFIVIIGILVLGNKYINEKNTKRAYNITIDLNRGISLNNFFEKLNLGNMFFKIYLKMEKDSGRNIKAGHYEFKGNYSYGDLLSILEEGRDKYTSLTIPEGYTILEIGELLESKGYGNVKKLNEALKNIKDFPYLTPKGNFQGYLYPETYYFSGEITPEKVAKRMLKEFLIKFPPKDYPDKEIFYKQLIMASILEREAQIATEKPIMASVFYNRLKKGMKLASDATVNFAYDYKKKRMYYKDLKIDSPYNTYMYKGLPPGPIANPDYESVMAAINPAKTKYLFFVATGGGHHTFTKTYREHLEVQKKKK